MENIQLYLLMLSAYVYLAAFDCKRQYAHALTQSLRHTHFQLIYLLMVNINCVYLRYISLYMDFAFVVLSAAAAICI